MLCLGRAEPRAGALAPRLPQPASKLDPDDPHVSVTGVRVGRAFRDVWQRPPRLLTWQRGMRACQMLRRPPAHRTHCTQFSSIAVRACGLARVAVRIAAESRRAGEGRVSQRPALINITRCGELWGGDLEAPCGALAGSRRRAAVTAVTVKNERRPSDESHFTKSPSGDRRAYKKGRRRAVPF